VVNHGRKDGNPRAKEWRRVGGIQTFRYRNRETRLNLHMRGETSGTANTRFLLLKAQMFLSAQTPFASSAATGLPAYSNACSAIQSNNVAPFLNDFTNDLVSRYSMRRWGTQLISNQTQIAST
jgi:hypothetical protein